MAGIDRLQRLELEKRLQFLREKKQRVESVLQESDGPEIRHEAEIELEQTVKQMNDVAKKLNG